MTTLSYTVIQGPQWGQLFGQALVYLSVMGIVFGTLSALIAIADFTLPRRSRINRFLWSLTAFVYGWGGIMVAGWLQANRMLS